MSSFIGSWRPLTQRCQEWLVTTASVGRAFQSLVVRAGEEGNVVGT